MSMLLLITGLVLATVAMIWVGEKTHLPYPVLMLLLTASVSFMPWFPDVHFEPELILPLFLPPLLFATAQRSSWSVFRTRWPALLLLAVGLIFATVAAVAGALMWLVPVIGLPTAVLIGAMVAPPDPVSVEAVAGPAKMPRRLLATLQSEGLFNDAAAIMIYQLALAAIMDGKPLIGPFVAFYFVVGAAGAVAIGFLMGWLTRNLSRQLSSAASRTALSMVVPFIAYILAEEIGASGVVAVVVTALELNRNLRPEDAQERINRYAFWDVAELMVTGIAFGLVGIELRQVIQDERVDLLRLTSIALVVCVVVIAVRLLWMWLMAAVIRWRTQLAEEKEGAASATTDTPATAETATDSDTETKSLNQFEAEQLKACSRAGNAPRDGKDVIILSWCGMRGLATLALALALPSVGPDGGPFMYRNLILVTAATVLLVTLVPPGLLFPWLMKLLKAQDDGSITKNEVHELSLRAQRAALDALQTRARDGEWPEEWTMAVRRQMFKLSHELEHGGAPASDPEHAGNTDNTAAPAVGNSGDPSTNAAPHRLSDTIARGLGTATAAIDLRRYLHPGSDTAAQRVPALTGSMPQLEGMSEAERKKLVGEKIAQGREAFIAIQTVALDAARAEVLLARNEPGVDPEVADMVLHNLDLRTMSLPHQAGI